MLQKEGRHHSVLMERLAQEVGCTPEDIVDFELNVCDTQPGVIGGVLGRCAGLVQASSAPLVSAACLYMASATHSKPTIILPERQALH